jgi:hypothetical protein
MILSLAARLTLWLRGLLYDGRIVVLSRASDQEGEGGNHCASSQVHEGHPQELHDG